MELMWGCSDSVVSAFYAVLWQILHSMISLIGFCYVYSFVGVSCDDYISPS